MAKATKIAHVDPALEAAKAQQAKAGGTVKLRATEVGYYGRPMADLVQPGTVFPMAVKDLEPLITAKDTASRIKDDTKRERLLQMIEDRETITHGGVVYLLPSWCEDASTAKAPESVAPPEDEIEQSDDVI